MTPKGRARLLLEVAGATPAAVRAPLTLTWRTSPEKAGAGLDVTVGRSASDYLNVSPVPVAVWTITPAGVDAVAPAARTPAVDPDFAHELRVRLDLASDRTGAECVHLDQVDAVAADYLPGPPKLRLIR